MTLYDAYVFGNGGSTALGQTLSTLQNDDTTSLRGNSELTVSLNGIRLSSQSSLRPLSPHTNYPHNSLTLTNTTETILSKTSSYNSNRSSNNKNIHFADSGEVPHHTTDASMDSNVAQNQGIAFAENIERQREIARRRLEQDRRFEDILQKIAGDHAEASTSGPNPMDQGWYIPGYRNDPARKPQQLQLSAAEFARCAPL